MKQIKILKYFLLPIFLLIGLISAIERIYWLQSYTYSPILANFQLKKFNENVDLVKFRENCGESLEIKSFGNIVGIRCGMLWPMRKVWLVSKSNFTPLN